MEELEKIFKRMGKDLGYRSKKTNKYVQKELQKTNCTLEDIVNFAQEKLDNTQKEHWRGYPISMFINAKITEHDKITLRTNPKGYAPLIGENKDKIEGLGYLLKRGQLTIIGDTGNNTGREQKGGTLTIKGNTGSYLCERKKGGKTIIEGDTKWSACFLMKGGITKILGNTGSDSCPNMKGGLFIAEGKIKDISKYWKGGIIIKNNKIKRMNLRGWNINTITSVDKHLPLLVVEKIVQEYKKIWHQDDWQKLIEKPETEYKIRLRKLDQELPVLIMEIKSPKKKLRALKAVEQEARANPTREIIKLAKECGVHTD